MSNGTAASAAATPAVAQDRGFTRLELQLNDYPGPARTALFGIQHVLVMFTAMVGGPLIVARLLKLRPRRWSTWSPGR
jgi:xanthine/uracil permease